MMKAIAERRRLATLRHYRLLDTPAEERWDRITRLTAATFGASISFVSLVDEQRQWFKSKVGFEAAEIPRKHSFCTHAIEHNDVMVVTDARSDARFKDNPLVTGHPNIRFYAAAPLICPDGSRIGTLCIIDNEPREQFDTERQAWLASLARMVMHEAESHRSSLPTEGRRRAGWSALAGVAAFAAGILTCGWNSPPESIAQWLLPPLVCLAMATTTAALTWTAMQRGSHLQRGFRTAPNDASSYTDSSRSAPDATAWQFALRESDDARWRKLLQDQGFDGPLYTSEQIAEARLSAFVQRQAAAPAAGGLLTTFCTSVTQQVQAAITATESAASSVMNRVQEVDSHISTLGDFVQNAEASSPQVLSHSDQSVSGNDGFIDGLRAYLTQQTEAATADRQRFERLATDAKALEELVAGLASVPVDTQILAINATTVAGRVDAAGAGPGIVTDDVHGLAQQVSHATTAVRTGLQRFTRNIHQMLEDRAKQEHITAEQKLLKDLAGKLAGLAEDHQEMLNHHGNLLAEINAAGNNIGNAVMTMMAEIQFQDIVRQRLECVLQGVEALAAGKDLGHAIEVLQATNRFEVKQAEGDSSNVAIELF